MSHAPKISRTAAGLSSLRFSPPIICIVKLMFLGVQNGPNTTLRAGSLETGTERRSLTRPLTYNGFSTAQYRDQNCLFTRNLEQCQPDSQHIQSKTPHCYGSPLSPNLEELLPHALVFKNVSLDEVADEPTSPSPFQLSLSQWCLQGLIVCEFHELHGGNPSDSRFGL
jgi:hypothetical protein